MLNGDNSILYRATDAKKKTEKAQDEETISLAYLAAITGNYTNGEDISTTLTDELEKTYGSGKVNVEKDGNVYKVSIDGKGDYTIDGNGKVEKAGPPVTYSEERIVANSNGSGTHLAAKTTEKGNKLYIYFEADVNEGNVTISPSIPFEITENGTYNFTITITLKGETYTTSHSVTADQFAVRAGINVGDYVNYTPTTAGTYSKDDLDEAHTGSTSNNSNLTQNTLNWRVLKIYDDGKIDLIANPTTYSIYIAGATGYNNGVYILNDICKKLYSNLEHNIEARSMNLEDFENNMTDVGKTTRDEQGKDSNIETQYGKTNYQRWNTTYSNGYYPNIYANENGSGIGSTTIKTDGLNISENGTLDLSIGNNAYKQAPENPGLITKKTAYILDIDSTNYGDAAKVLSSRSCWVASRFVDCSSSYAIFGLSAASSKKSVMIFFKSDTLNTTYNVSNGIRPVVQLSPDIKITLSDKASTDSSKPHTINW